MNSYRKLAVNGQFYPNTKKELGKYFEHFNIILQTNNITVGKEKDARAIIVPHAGYIYSGFTANMAYRCIPDESETIVVIGPSHKFGFKGASIANYNTYPTPLGDIDIDQKLTRVLLEKFEFLDFYDQVHCEHSTETQMPFIKYYQENKKVVEIVYSDIDIQNLSKLIDEVLDDPLIFLVISTDLSHFYTLDEAQKLDSICIQGIKDQDIHSLENGCEACGIKGIQGLLVSKWNNKLQTKILDYRTSADVSKDTQRVVGYLSVVFVSKE